CYSICLRKFLRRNGFSLCEECKNWHAAQSKISTDSEQNSTFVVLAVSNDFIAENRRTFQQLISTTKGLTKNLETITALHAQLDRQIEVLEEVCNQQREAMLNMLMRQLGQPAEEVRMILDRPQPSDVHPD
ncbi:hypothetical protein PFISCL1PPCAC_11699, partial [Pristionchus fissidentatus]